MQHQCVFETESQAEILFPFLIQRMFSGWMEDYYVCWCVSLVLKLGQISLPSSSEEGVYLYRDLQIDSPLQFSYIHIIVKAHRLSIAAWYKKSPPQIRAWILSSSAPTRTSVTMATHTYPHLDNFRCLAKALQIEIMLYASKVGGRKSQSDGQHIRTHTSPVNFQLECS